MISCQGRRACDGRSAYLLLVAGQVDGGLRDMIGEAFVGYDGDLDLVVFAGRGDQRVHEGMPVEIDDLGLMDVDGRRVVVQADELVERVDHDGAATARLGHGEEPAVGLDIVAFAGGRRRDILVRLGLLGGHADDMAELAGSDEASAHGWRIRRAYLPVRSCTPDGMRVRGCVASACVCVCVCARVCASVCARVCVCVRPSSADANLGVGFCDLAGGALDWAHTPRVTLRGAGAVCSAPVLAAPRLFIECRAALYLHEVCR